MPRLYDISEKDIGPLRRRAERQNRDLSVYSPVEENNDPTQSDRSPVPILMPIRTYADTSVYGGLHDEEFAEASRQFFAQVRAGRFKLVTSAVVDDELEEAPPEVQSDYEALLPEVTVAEITDEALELQQAYLDAGILTPTWEDDALHIAMATVQGCELIVSWNFQHIVHFQEDSAVQRSQCPSRIRHNRHTLSP